MYTSPSPSSFCISSSTLINKFKEKEYLYKLEINRLENLLVELDKYKNQEISELKNKLQCNKNSQLYGEEDKPTCIEYYPSEYGKNGNIKCIEYYPSECGKNRNIKCKKYYNKNNQLHREGVKPAWIEYFENGNVKIELYYINKKRHREGDKPASISYYENGNIDSETYYINGNRHREGDKPAWIKYYPSECGKTGNIKCESYYINYELHREGDKPAWIEYYPSECGKTGNIKRESYYIKSKCCREDDKPNRIEYSDDGNTITEKWTNEYGVEVKRNVILLNNIYKILKEYNSKITNFINN